MQVLASTGLADLTGLAPLGGLTQLAQSTPLAREAAAPESLQPGRPPVRLLLLHRASSARLPGGGDYNVAMRQASRRSRHEPMRIDRWLFFVRLFKSRSLAGEAVSGGRVHVNGERVKPARVVRIGDQVAFNRGAVPFDCEVLGLPLRRGPAPQAAACYRESRGQRGATRAVRASGCGRRRPLRRARTPDQTSMSAANCGASGGGIEELQYYDLILGAYVCVLLCANLIGPAKVTTLHLPVVGIRDLRRRGAVLSDFLLLR